MTTTMTTWLSAPEACRALGISPSTLKRWRVGGLLKAGIHWRRKFPITNSPVLYDLERCSAAMRQASASSIDAIEPALVMPVI